MVGCGLFIFYVRKNFSVINLLLLTIIFIATFLVEGKTAILTLISGLVTYYLVLRYSSGNLTIKNSFLSILFLFGLVTMMILIRGDSIIDFDLNKFTTGRFDGWLIYFDLITNKNTLLGFGIQGGEIINAQGTFGFKHPHNIFLEVLFTTGILGFTVLIVLWILFYKKLFSVNIQPEKRALLATTFIVILVSSQGFWSIWSKNHVMPILIILSLSLLIQLNRKLSN